MEEKTVFETIIEILKYFSSYYDAERRKGKEINIDDIGQELFDDILKKSVIRYSKSYTRQEGVIKYRKSKLWNELCSSLSGQEIWIIPGEDRHQIRKSAICSEKRGLIKFDNCIKNKKDRWWDNSGEELDIWRVYFEIKNNPRWNKLVENRTKRQERNKKDISQEKIQLEDSGINPKNISFYFFNEGQINMDNKFTTNDTDICGNIESDIKVNNQTSYGDNNGMSNESSGIWSILKKIGSFLKWLFISN